MKAEAIMKALGKAEGRGMAEDALNNLPDGGQPAELPAEPETGAKGPPETIPPVETGGAPETPMGPPMFDEATGLPMIVIDKLPEDFRADDDEDDPDMIV